MLSADDARTLYRELSDAGVRCRVVVGWGVDALVDRQTRPHQDLDVLVLRQDLQQLNHMVAEHDGVRTLLWPNENLWDVIDGATCPTELPLRACRRKNRW